MIYEMLTTTLNSLAGQWRDLRATLELIRPGLAPGDPAAPIVDDILDDIGPTASIPATGHVPHLEGVARLIPGSGSPDNALTNAIQALRDSRTFQGATVGTFNLAFGSPNGGDSDLVEQGRTELDRLGSFISDELGELELIRWGSSTPYNLGRIRGTVDDLAAYPVLTSEAAPLSSPGPTGGTVGTALQRSVDTAIRETIGCLPKYTDSKAFVAALNQSFEVNHTAGQSLMVWRARSSAGLSDLGGTVTGFQASLYARARDAMAAVEPILATLTPLIPDADQEEMDAARGIVQAEVLALVDELGVEGGPRVARVDQLFELLLTQEITGIGNIPVQGGMVGYVGSVFGLEASNVNTIDEEQNFSRFLLLRDYLETTRVSWTSFRDGQLGRDLGTRLVLLSRALQVVAESVDEVEAALDSVFVGPAERGVARFRTASGGDMLVAELLSWISSFSSTEAPELVQEGGRRGCGAIVGTTDQLRNLVQDLIAAIDGDPTLPDGMRHPRVRHPLSELQTYLGRVSNLASQVRVASTV
jgi:hypothetical protein